MTIKIGDCSIADCGNNGVRVVRGWCMPHYERWRAHGDPLAGKAMKGEPMSFFNETVLHHDSNDCLFWPYATSGGGYAQLFKDGKVIYVHREVCAHVHGEAPTPEHEAAHSCGLGHLGCVAKAHLSWKTRVANQADRLRHGTHNRGERCAAAKLTAEQVIQIRHLHKSSSAKELGERFGVSDRAIRAIADGANWGWLESPQ